MTKKWSLMKRLLLIIFCSFITLSSSADMYENSLWRHTNDAMRQGKYEEAYKSFNALSLHQDTVFKQIYFKDIADLHNRYRFNDLKLENEKRSVKERKLLIGTIFLVTFLTLGSIILLYWHSQKLVVMRKKLEEEKNLAEESVRHKSLFLSTMSHEIRTPLNALAGFSEVLSMDGIDDDIVKQSNEAIQMNSELLMKLIHDVADLSMMDTEHMTFNLAPCDAVIVCRGVTETMQKIKHTPADILFKSDLDTLIVNTDSQRVQQVLINLIVNASKYTKEGSITIGLEKKEDTVYFSVTDTGCGIPLDQQQKIFNRFEKLNENVQGTGLGLSICKIIVTELGGDIWIDSSYTHGSRFVFSLPMNERRQA